MKIFLSFLFVIYLSSQLYSAENVVKDKIKKKDESLDPVNGGGRSGNSTDDPKNGGGRSGNSTDDPKNGGGRSGNSTDDPKNGGGRGGNSTDDPKNGGGRGGNSTDDPKNGGGRGGLSGEKNEMKDLIMKKLAESKELSPLEHFEALYLKIIIPTDQDCLKLIKLKNFDISEVDKLNFLLEQVIICHGKNAYTKNNEFEVFINSFFSFLNKKINSHDEDEKKNCSRLDKDSVEYLKILDSKTENENID
jgi:hypothetical protein